MTPSGSGIGSERAREAITLSPRATRERPILLRASMRAQARSRGAAQAPAHGLLRVGRRPRIPNSECNPSRGHAGSGDLSRWEPRGALTEVGLLLCWWDRIGGQSQPEDPEFADRPKSAGIAGPSSKRDSPG
jgi:hypothetical protein